MFRGVFWGALEALTPRVTTGAPEKEEKGKGKKREKKRGNEREKERREPEREKIER